jgi:hypothetical protein
VTGSRLTCIDVSISAGAILAAVARGNASNGFLLARRIPDLMQQLGEVADAVDTLDIFAHGFGGGMTFGRQTLFASDGYGYGRLPALARVLRRSGRLRLLGCETALDSSWRGGEVQLSGRRLLRDLAERMGSGVTVWGSTVWLSPFEFDRLGLCEDAAARLLVSSADTAESECEVGVAGGV